MGPKLVMLLLAVLLPPLAVALRHGESREFFVCVILTLCGFLPGVVYALWVLRSA